MNFYIQIGCLDSRDLLNVSLLEDLLPEGGKLIPSSRLIGTQGFFGGQRPEKRLGNAICLYVFLKALSYAGHLLIAPFQSLVLEEKVQLVKHKAEILLGLWYSLKK